MTPPTSRSAPLIALAIGLLAAASGCGGTGPDRPKAHASPSPSASVVGGVRLTAPGTQLQYGESAKVSYEPNADRSSLLRLQVKKVKAGRISDLHAYQLDAQAKASTPYYVTASVKNIGEGDVGGTGIPLWATSSDHVLVQASGFTARFKTCPSTPLPSEFAAGATTQACLVFLVPEGGRLTGVDFQGAGEEKPVTWTGEIQQPTVKKKGASNKKGASKKKAGS